MQDGLLLFNNNLVIDETSKYWLYYTNTFDTTGATLILDSNNVPITGLVSGSTAITFTFEYSALTNSAYTAVAIGLDESQYIITTGTFHDNSAQTIYLYPNNELCYSALSGINWNTIYNTPTTLIGYNINAYLNDLIDVNTGGTLEGYVLTYSSGTWVGAPSNGSGSTIIGPPETGTAYTNGLYEDFVDSTKIGTPIDRFNKILKYLVPQPAPDLTDANGTKSSTVSGYLSFGSGNTITNYNNADENGSAPSVGFKELFSTASKRFGISAQNISNITGTLNYQVAADGVNYLAASWGDANNGTLELYINNTLVDSIDLTNTAATDTTSGSTTSGFVLSSCNNAHFTTGEEFDLFKNRTGTWFVKATELSLGYNWIQIVHSMVGTIIRFDLVIDDSTTATTYTGETFSNLSMTGSKQLSGIKYYTGGSLDYNVTIQNAYKNTYSSSASAIQFVGSNCSCASLALPSPTDQNSDVVITSRPVTITATKLLVPDSMTLYTRTLRTVQSTVNSSTVTISDFLMHNISTVSTDLIEYFLNENKRIPYDAYDLISSITGYSSALSLTGNTELQYYDDTLIYPSYNFSSYSDLTKNLNYGDSVYDYSTCSGTRYFLRYFYKDPATQTHALFTINIAGTGTIIDSTGSLGTGNNNLKVQIKLPGTAAAETGWMDIYKNFVTGNFSDDNGCKNQTAAASLNSTISLSIGTKNTAYSDGYVLLKITVGEGWTGNISQINFNYI